MKDDAQHSAIDALRREILVELAPKVCHCSGDNTRIYASNRRERRSSAILLREKLISSVIEQRKFSRALSAPEKTEAECKSPEDVRPSR